MLSSIYVMLGGALGTGARYRASGVVARRFGQFFQLGPLTVNFAGSNAVLSLGCCLFAVWLGRICVLTFRPT
jgi:fluoride ion exporter CrcB/FEX